MVAAVAEMLHVKHSSTYVSVENAFVTILGAG